MRNVLLAGGYGLIAGMVSAAVLKLMSTVQSFLWQGDELWWTSFLILMAGGALIALIRHRSANEDLEQQLAQARDPLALKKLQTLFTGLTAIIAVGFGGAIGPEAGLLAVIAELSYMVVYLVARNEAEQQLIGESGAVASLSAFYGSPPGALAYDSETEPPKPLLFLAAVTGLAGFFLAAGWLFDGGMHQLGLPDYTPSSDGRDMLMALIPAALGVASALLYRAGLPWMKRQLARVGKPAIQTLVGSLLFALLAASSPLLRFSGHGEFDAMLAWAEHSGWLMLLFLGLLKCMALILCLSSGWLGGPVFPLIFSGAAMGAVSVALVPGMEPTVALVAGMGAAVGLGLGKPIAAMLILVFMVGTGALGPLLVGVLIGYGVSFHIPELPAH